MKKILFFTIIVSTFSFAGKGSIYSRFGVGEINSFISGRSVGMGNTGIALLDNSYINLSNPAALGMINRSLLTAGYQYQNFASTDDGGTSLFGTGNINSFALAFPIYTPKKIALSIAALPFSTVGYEQQLSTPFNGTSILQTFDGRGGISSAQLGISYSPAQNVMVGFTTHYLFGAIFRDKSIVFPNGDYHGGSYSETFSMRGFGFTFGGIYTGIDKLFGFSETRQVNLGATVFTGSSMTIDDETLTDFSSNTDTLKQNNQSATLPVGFSLGLSYNLRNINYTADLNFQNWDNFKLKGVHPAEIQNSIRIGAGVEFLPPKDFTDTYLEKVAYRVGGYFRQSYLKINGHSINEIFGTAGIGLPLSAESRMNIGVEYGIRGTTSSSLIKDNVFRLVLSLTASELMFIEPPVE